MLYCKTFTNGARKGLLKRSFLCKDYSNKSRIRLGIKERKFYDKLIEDTKNNREKLRTILNDFAGNEKNTELNKIIADKEKYDKVSRIATKFDEYFIKSIDEVINKVKRSKCYADIRYR